MFNNILELFINKKKIKAFFSSKDVLIFLFFLFLSFCFWYLHSLQKNYEITIPIAVDYINIPYDKINADALPKTVEITVKDHGSYLLSYKIKKTDPIILDLQKVASLDKKNLYISGDVLSTVIKPLIHHTTSVVKITPKEIIVPIVEKAEKRLEVKHKGKITFAQQYSFSDNITITPAYIVVYGDKNAIDTMQYVYTEKIDFKNLKDTVKEIIPLQKISGIQFEVNEIDIHIPVEKYTEKTIEVPITGINFPSNMELRTFPAALNVNFFVTFSKFNSVNGNSIKATIDYHSIVNNKTGKQKPTIESNNPFIFNIRTNPSEVEYIMEHKY